MGIKKIVYKFLRVFPIKKNRILFLVIMGQTMAVRLNI